MYTVIVVRLDAPLWRAISLMCIYQCSSNQLFIHTNVISQMLHSLWFTIIMEPRQDHPSFACGMIISVAVWCCRVFVSVLFWCCWLSLLLLFVADCRLFMLSFAVVDFAFLFHLFLTSVDSTILLSSNTHRSFLLPFTGVTHSFLLIVVRSPTGLSWRMCCHKIYN